MPEQFATFFQVGLIMAALLISYNFNKDYWGGFMGSVLNIPSDVLIAFAVFGLGGFLFYAFMYGALGALVSKIEDLNKSAGTAQMIVMIVYFVVLMNLTNVDGLVIRSVHIYRSVLQCNVCKSCDGRCGNMGSCYISNNFIYIGDRYGCSGR